MVWRIVITLLKISVIITIVCVICWSWAGAGEIDKGQSMPEKTIEQVLQDNTDSWMSIPGVNGTAIGLFEGKPCIRIFTSLEPQQLQDKIKSTVEGYPVIIEETGSFNARDK